MFFLIKTIHNFLKLLNSETAPSQLAAGVALGMIAGFTPTLSLHNLILFFVVCLFRINFSMYFLSLGIFAILSFALDPFFDWFGYVLLADAKAMRPFWISITSGPILPFFKFNNTVVLGSLASSLILFIPIWVTAVQLIKQYRTGWREQIQQSKFMKILKATPIYGVYDKYQNLKAKFSLS